jgi:hypothetical protein
MRSDIQPGATFPDYELPDRGAGSRTAEESKGYLAAPSGGSASS